MAIVVTRSKKASFSTQAQVTLNRICQTGLPLETKNTQNHENRRLGLIESLHMQHCSLRGCVRPPAPA